MDTRVFGMLPDGSEARLFRIANGEGTAFAMSDYGATLVSFTMKDADGQEGELLLGYDELEPYLSASMYSGATVGRVCNRIAGGEFHLDGRRYGLDANEGKHHLHGGVPGFHSLLWDVEPVSNVHGEGLHFSRLSPDGEAGYPGNLSVRLCVTLSDSNVLRFRYEAETDQATPINLTNHAYWNLFGRGDIFSQSLELPMSKVLETDDECIPTGRILLVSGTPLDFREAKELGRDIEAIPQRALGGYDHCYVVDGWKDDETLRKVATLFDPSSRRCMELHTDCPGMQLYTGNHMRGEKARNGDLLEAHQALCLETQFFPDSVHHSQFPSVVLRPGESYRTATEHRFFIR